MTQRAATQRRFIVTVDDPGGLIQDLETLQRALDFFETEGVGVSFFVVPRGQGGWQLDQRNEWVAALRRAEEQGHDCQLHGLDHAHCEFGPVPAIICALGGRDFEARLKSDLEQCGHLWRRELFVEKLNTALRIFDEAMGRKPLAFRSGALSQSPELYEALADVGVRYVSNKVTDPRGWKYIVGDYEAPGDWDPDVPPAPYNLTPDIIDLPIISEYAWQLTPEKIEKHLALALEDVQRVYEANGVFLLVCHVQEVGAEHPLSRQLLHRLFEAARNDHEVTFLTVRDLVADIQSGAVPVLTP